MLIDSGYTLAEKISIFMKPGYAGIAYSDGDTIENRIANIIAKAQDLSIFSRELAVQCTDWPSLYHLSGTRANILRPFHSILKQANVLEIGAGCGAITRYLGESGANVLALEGSPRRAAIARSRTRELENVTVVADKFDQFQCDLDLRFDIITLIGVLEYAALFTDDENPVVSMLTRIRELLKPEGRLILAIENQLGLKYFAGAAEDHTGEPMLGIEGRYSTKGPRTFGRKVLATKLQQAGFINQQFMAPFPDYKLPISILTEQGLHCDTFDAAALCWQSARRDPQLASPLVFAPELAWPVVDANGLTLELANSFLVAAQTSIEADHNNSILAYHYSTNGRHAAFCKETLFIQQDSCNIKLAYNLLDPHAKYSKEGKHILFSVSPKSEYVSGKLLSLQFIRTVTRKNWHIKEVGNFLRMYLDIVQSYLVIKNQPTNFESINSLLPGICFDLVPQNIICLDDGSYQVIDQEWILKDKMPLGWLLLRVLIQLISNVTRFGKSLSKPLDTRLDFILASFEETGFKATEKDIKKYSKFEDHVQIDICYLDSAQATFFPLDLNAKNSYLSFHDLLREQEQSIIATTANIASKNEEINILKQNLSDQSKNITLLYTFLSQNTLLKIGFHFNRFNPISIIKYYKYIRIIKNSQLFCYDWYTTTYHALQDFTRDPLIFYYHFGYLVDTNPNPFFDSKWYINTYKDVKEKKINPLLHYILYGAREGRNPSPYFNTNWYLNEYSDVKESNQNPLAHFLTYGSKEGRNPNPYFDSQWYKNTYPEIESTGIEPLLHYMTIGWHEGKNPSPYFNAKWYLNKYPDVREQKIDPLVHYMFNGCKEGRDPNPLFNSKWYIKKYPEVLDRDQDPLLNYINSWASELKNPNEFFDTEWYLTLYSDVKELGIDPLIHYLIQGAAEGKNPCPSFNTNWYLEEYQDVRDSGINPFEHYIHYGHSEGRRTAPDLSVKINIRHGHPVGILHTPHTKYVADQIATSLKKFSINSFLSSQQPEEYYDETVYFVICPQIFSSLPKNYIAYQLEQTTNQRWFDFKYYSILENSLAILDYSTENIEYLRNELKIQNRQIYYVPVDYIKNYDQKINDQDEIYDVLFYGDPHCDRRHAILSQLNQFFDVKIINNTFGIDLYNEISKSKIIVNIHYYENALLETTRIWECLSLNKLIVSEKSVDIEEHNDLFGLVDFVEINDVDTLIKRINYWLGNETHRKNRISENNHTIKKRINRFDFFFFRFLLAHENISFNEFWNTCGKNLKLNNEKITCLTLPEFTERKKEFKKTNSIQVNFFNGLKHYKHNWIGCGMSYKLMIKIAQQQKFKHITICEDDVKFLPDFEKRFNIIGSYLEATADSWDIFSGFMSDISEDIIIKEMIYLNDHIILSVNKMISAVFNCYNSTSYDFILTWDENNFDVYTNTIDRFLEQNDDLSILLSFPFLVEHNESLQSVIWGFQNDKYNELINKSVQTLEKKISVYKAH